ncbi:MAG: lysophospholipase, partial [Candidatus Hydrogenedentota bacterium]
SGEKLSKSTVARCAFDGETLSYVEHGDELAIDVPRGFNEPSIAKYKDRYFLTLRNDEKGYVTVGDDGLHYAEPIPWTFDDGSELGSYNTQQHWLVHEDGLFLTYTRRGAGNDHIMRHRAPLFIAQVDPERLCVIRATEKVLIPERGATLGNFGAAPISPRESWVTVGEGVWNDDARKRGANGAVFVARVLWQRPNTLTAPK